MDSVRITTTTVMANDDADVATVHSLVDTLVCGVLIGYGYDVQADQSHRTDLAESLRRHKGAVVEHDGLERGPSADECCRVPVTQAVVTLAQQSVQL